MHPWCTSALPPTICSRARRLPVGLRDRFSRWPAARTGASLPRAEDLPAAARQLRARPPANRPGPEFGRRFVAGQPQRRRLAAGSDRRGDPGARARRRTLRAGRAGGRRRHFLCRVTPGRHGRVRVPAGGGSDGGQPRAGQRPALISALRFKAKNRVRVRTGNAPPESGPRSPDPAPSPSMARGW